MKNTFQRQLPEKDVLPVYRASPVNRAKLAKSNVEKLALFNKPDILRFFLRLEAREGRP